MGTGVVCAEDAAAAAASAASWRRFCGSLLRTSPRSVAEKEMEEQNPSDEVTSNVMPSEDLISD